MKALFLIFHSFYEANGISKKINYQIEALRSCGVDTELCYVFEENGFKQRRVNSTIIADYGNGIKGKILKRIEFLSVAKYVVDNKFDFIYVRSAHNAHPFTIQMVKQIHQAGISILMEIPTYPYDQEYDTFRTKMNLLIDKCFRNRLAKYVDYMVTFSDEKVIFGKPTIRISNGIDFSQIKVKKELRCISKEIHFIGVAEIHYWHGFDRFIEGLGIYYLNNPELKVYFHIVGDFFGNRERNDILSPIEKYNLQDSVILHGAQQGAALDLLFEQADMAIGSLARHRSGVFNIKTLKNREYAARGIPFIYSEIDSDFDNTTYIIKAPSDESAIDIKRLILFRKNLNMTSTEIHESVKHLSWKIQMSKILTQLKSVKIIDNS